MPPLSSFWLGRPVWRVDLAGGRRRGELVSVDGRRRLVNVAWTDGLGDGGVFHVSMAAFDGVSWGFEPGPDQPEGEPDGMAAMVGAAADTVLLLAAAYLGAAALACCQP